MDWPSVVMCHLNLIATSYKKDERGMRSNVMIDHIEQSSSKHSARLGIPIIWIHTKANYIDSIRVY